MLQIFHRNHISILLKCKCKPTKFCFSTTTINNDNTMTEQTLSLAQGVLNYDRTSLAKSITLIESSNDLHKKQAEYLLNYIEKNKNKELMNMKRGFGGLGTPTFRIGFAGPPGAGKSTFIEAFGKFLIEGNRIRKDNDNMNSNSNSNSTHPMIKKMNKYEPKHSPIPYYHNIAVLPVDPSSHISGGSILGKLCV